MIVRPATAHTIRQSQFRRNYIIYLTPVCVCLLCGRVVIDFCISVSVRDGKMRFSCCASVEERRFLNCPRVFASFQYVDALSTRWIIMGMISPLPARRRRSTQTVRPKRPGPATGRPALPRPALLPMAMLAEAVPCSNLRSMMAGAVPRSTLLAVAGVKVSPSRMVTVRTGFFFYQS